MHAVVHDDVVSARRQAGHDRRDFEIEGTYYMVPPATEGHGNAQGLIFAVLLQRGVRPERLITDGGVGTAGNYIVGDVVILKDGCVVDPGNVYRDPGDVAFVVEVLSDSNSGETWRMKLSALEGWGVAIALFDRDRACTNLKDLPAPVQKLLS